MAHMAPFAESDFDSIHSSQAFIGDHQVMFTPPLRAKKQSRFASTQSYILPDIPNTSQIVGGSAEELPKMRPSTNENQIVNALTRMQKQLDQAKTTIKELMRERDEYRGEAKMLRQILAQTQRSMRHRAIKSKAVEDVDYDLLNFTQYSEADDDFTQQLPTLNIPKAKSDLKAVSEWAQPLQKRPQRQTVSNDVPTPRAAKQHFSHLPRNQQLDTKRQPLREISESVYQQRSQISPQKAGKKVVIEAAFARDGNQNITAQTNGRAPTRNITYLSNVPDNQPFTALRNQLEAERLNRRLSTTKDVDNYRQDTARSTRAVTAPPLEREPVAVLEDKEFTAASNTSRRRRRASDTGGIDEGMTSAYLLQEITIPNLQSHLEAPQPPQPPRPPRPEQPKQIEQTEQPKQPAQSSVEVAPSSEQPQPGQLSEEAKNLLHSVDPDHIVSCIHCRRLLRLPEKLQVKKDAAGWDWCMMLGDR